MAIRSTLAIASRQILIPNKIMVFPPGTMYRPNQNSRRTIPFSGQLCQQSGKVDCVWKKTIEDRKGELFEDFDLNTNQQNQFARAIQRSETPVKSLLMPKPANKSFTQDLLQWTAENHQGKLAILNISSETNASQRIDHYNFKDRELKPWHLDQFQGDLQARVFSVYLLNIRLTPEAIVQLSEFLDQHREEIQSFAVFSQQSRFFATI